MFFGNGLLDDIEAARSGGMLSAPQTAQPAGMLGKSWDEFYQPYFNTGSYADRPGDLNLELREGNANELAKLIGFSGATTSPMYYTQGGMNEGGDTTFQAKGNAYTPDFLKALEQYKFTQADPYRTSVIDQGGQNLGTFKSGDEESAFDKFAWQAVPLAIAAMGAGAFGGWAPGAEGAAGGAGTISGGGGLTAGGSAGYGSIGGTLGGSGGTTLGLAGGGMSGGAGINSALLQSLGAGAAGTAATLPSSGLNAMRLGEIASYATNGSMPSSAATAEGGGLLGSPQSTAGQIGAAVRDNPVSAWMKANPTLGKLLMSGGTSLLSAAGGGSSGSGQAESYGPAKQWGSPLQQGLLGQVQQTMPSAIQQRPSGLLAQGNANSGAWRFLGG